MQFLSQDRAHNLILRLTASAISERRCGQWAKAIRLENKITVANHASAHGSTADQLHHSAD
jgi:hypothetical protein